MTALYELLCGERPFSGEVGEVIQKIMAGRCEEAPLREKGVETRVIRTLKKILNKDPERRYQNAQELGRDLEALVRQTRIVDSDESRLEILVRAHFPLINVLSFEEDRVLQAVRRISERLAEDRGKPRRTYFWSASQGLRDEAGKLISPDSLNDPTAALVHVIENPEDAVYVFLDLHYFFSPVTTRLVRDAARAVRLSRKSLLFVSPHYRVPDELEKDVSLLVFGLPDAPHMENLLERVAEDIAHEGLEVSLGPDERTVLVRAALGLTLNEAERAFRAAAYRRNGLVPGAERDVIEEKTQIIRKTGILEYYHSSESFGDVGGLKNLMAWFQSRRPGFEGTARHAGLGTPKGVLLVGVPGCGKSLTARALAGAWRVPLLRLDVGSVFGPYVGQSEANLRRAILTSEAVSPCILWIDEVEKGFAGARSDGGGGVGLRVFGSFLTWLQEKQSPVFVVATANDLSGIPPEFLRSGRFDERFFVGLPASEERGEILRIHLQKRKRDPQRFDLNKMVEHSEGFSGAEMEQAIISGLFHAFDARRELNTEDILTGLAQSQPLSASHRDLIGGLMAWAKENARMAN